MLLKRSTWTSFRGLLNLTLQPKSRMVLLCFALFYHPLEANAQSSCNVDEAFKRLFVFNMKARQEKYEETKSILYRLAELTAKAKNPALPVGMQLSKRDLEEDESLSEKILDETLRDLFRSNLERDAQVLIGVAKLSEAEFHGKKNLETDPNYKYFQMKMFVWATMPEPNFDLPFREGECSIGASFAKMQMDALADMMPAEKANALVRALRVFQQKYQVEDKPGWINKLPNGVDKTQATEIDAVLTRQKSMFEHVKLLQNIRIIQDMSDRQYATLITALNKARNRAEMNSVGSVYDDLRKTNVDADKKAMDLLDVMSKMFPSEAVLMQERMSKPLLEQGLISNR